MSDNELIEMAAKAVGLKVQYSENWGDYSIGEPYSKEEKRWNPLNSDSDALWLVIELNMNLEITDQHVYACAYGNCSEPAKPDKKAAVRRVIVRAAAEVGRAIT